MSGPRPPRLSASARVLLAMTGMISLTIVVLVTIAYSITSRALQSELESSLTRESAVFSAAVRESASVEQLAEATRVYLRGRTSEGTGSEILLLVVLNSGRTISNSEVRLEDAPGNVGTQSPPDAPSFSDVSLDGVTYRVLTSPILLQGNRLAVFQAAIDKGSAEATARRVALTLAAAGLIALALVLPLSYWATRRSLTPLRQMAADASRISHAQPGGRIAYEGPRDELGSLAETLNAMLARLESAYEDQRRFVADASHELRTPVAVIRGNVELLRSGRQEETDRQESLATIEDETARMGRLLDELLSLARFDSARRAAFQPLEVRAMLDEVAARTRPLGDREVKVTGECRAWVEGNPDLLDQALANLVRNAIAHTVDGGRIGFNCSRDGGRVAVSVTDDGVGIPEGNLERVFDRFYRSPGRRRETEGGGAGLGLAITRRIVELHGGTIRAENVQPHGAKFTIELPEIKEPSEASAMPA